MNILEEAKNLQEQIVSWRRHLHTIPEIGLVLPKTSAFIQEQLTQKHNQQYGLHQNQLV